MIFVKQCVQRKVPETHLRLVDGARCTDDIHLPGPGASAALQKPHLASAICPSPLDTLGVGDVCCHILVSTTEYFFFLPSFKCLKERIVQCMFSNSQDFPRPTHVVKDLPMTALLCLVRVFSMPWCEAGILDFLQRQKEFGGERREEQAEVAWGHSRQCGGRGFVTEMQSRAGG